MDKKQKDNLLDLVIRFKEVMDSREYALNSFCKYGVVSQKVDSTNEEYA